MNFKAFKTTTNADDTVNIHGVPIFKLGRHKGFNYSTEWAEKTFQNHQKLEKTDFFPPLILGHNDPKKPDEKPAKGFFGNLKLEGKTILADFLKMPKDVFESAIKKREYPHRSVEVDPDKNIFTALALLGGTTPYHKLSVLEAFKENADGVWVGFSEKEDQNGLIKLIAEQFNAFKTEILGIVDKQEEPQTKEGEMGKEFTDAELQAKFAEKYGKTPEEVFAENEKYKTEQAEQLKASRKVFKDSILKEWKAKGVSPAILDEKISPFLDSLPDGMSVKFSEESTMTGLTAFKSLIDGIVEAAEKNALVADFNEHTQHLDYKPTPKDRFSDDKDVDPDSAAIHQKAVALMQKNTKLTYAEAINTVCMAV